MTNVKTVAKLALAALAGSLALSGCNNSSQGSSSSLVACYNVSKFGVTVPVMMQKGDCDKIAGSTSHTITANDYVACYGVAAAGKNDCATNASACGGSVTANNAPNAWITLPQGVCAQLKGSTIGNLDKKAGAATSTPKSSS